MNRPNIVLLLTDEMRASALGRDGSPLCPHPDPTPRLDAAAARGATFDNAHCVHPKCTPSRTSILTGQYPHVGGHRTLDLPGRPDEPNMVRALRDAGYQTVLIGRNHVTDAEATRQTWDLWEQTQGRTLLDPPEWACPVEGSYLYGRDPRPLPETVDVIRTRAAERWLREDRDEDRPFFLWLNLEYPHPALRGQRSGLRPDRPGRDRPAAGRPDCRQAAAVRRAGRGLRDGSDRRRVVAGDGGRLPRDGDGL